LSAITMQVASTCVSNFKHCWLADLLSHSNPKSSRSSCKEQLILERVSVSHTKTEAKSNDSS